MDWFSATLGLATEVFKFINTEASRKYLDQKVRLELDVNEELSKPYDQQDDARIVELKKQAIVIAEAAKVEFQIWQAKK
jgi:hypothetical protein